MSGTRLATSLKLHGEGAAGHRTGFRQQARSAPGRASSENHLSDLRPRWQGHRGRRTNLAAAFRYRASGRTVASKPKYKNSPETTIYSKRRTLYALNWAKDDIIKSDEIIVCEGYTDVIAFFTAGMPRAVATCGTALGEEHFKTMRNFAKRIVLAYDADKAGQSAAASVYQWETPTRGRRRGGASAEGL